MAEVQFSVSWDAYQKSICNGLSSLQQKGEFVDMTIAADGHHVKVHQMVLSLVSPFIKQLITSAQCPHPIIFLNQVSYQTLQSILEFAYTGEVLVTRDRLAEFLEACKNLHIKGLEKTINYTETTEREIHTQFDDMNNKTPDIEENTNITSNTDFQITIDNSKMEEDYTDSHYLEDTNDDDDFNDLRVTTIKNNTPLHTGKKVIVKENAPPSMLQYSVSCQGSLQLVLNRYMYSLSYTRKDSQRLWRCNYQRLKCPAFVTTKGDRVLERSGVHNHPFHDRQILKRVKTGNMFTALNEAETASAVKRRKNKEDKEEDCIITE